MSLIQSDFMSRIDLVDAITDPSKGEDYVFNYFSNRHPQADLSRDNSPDRSLSTDIREFVMIGSNYDIEVKIQD